jgi:DNA-binding CsgD family transcriptional regulator
METINMAVWGKEFHPIDDRSVAHFGPVDRFQGRRAKPHIDQLIVASLTASGLTSFEIAVRVKLPRGTVARRLAELRVSFGAATTSQAIAICYERGWLPLQKSDELVNTTEQLDGPTEA